MPVKHFHIALKSQMLAGVDGLFDQRFVTSEQILDTVKLL